MIREVRSGGSFQSQADLRLHFGLGPVEGPITAEIVWPDWRRQTVSIDEIDRYVDVTYDPDSADAESPGRFGSLGDH